MTATKLMLGRRPDVGKQQAAFGHVALNAAAQSSVEGVVADATKKALGATQITYDPDDAPGTGEVMVHPLLGIDAEFQPKAPWSLENAIAAISKTGKPSLLDKGEVAGGGWSFYALRAGVDGKAAVAIRATTPTRSLTQRNRFITHLVGNELRPVQGPMIGIDHSVDAVVYDGTVYIFKPQRLELLFVDAEEIKRRAPAIVAKFTQGLQASLSTGAATWIEKACSENSNVGRRVERLNRTASLGSMTIAKLRSGLPDAKLEAKDFGASSKVIDVASLDHAIALVDIAADLYYQPRFESTSRKVASFRRLS